MPATPEQLLARLDALGIESTTHSHPPVFTVEESQRLCGHLPGGHCKNLFLKDKKGALWLVVTEEDRAIDMKRLDKVIGSARLSFGKAELLEDVLGVIPGAVTPFALINDTDHRVNVVLDAAMLDRHETLNYHPISNAMTTQISPEDLVAFIRACGHEPRIINLDGEAE